MQNFKYIFITVFLFTIALYSCNHKQDDNSAYKLLDEGLINARVPIHNQMILTLAQLEAKFYDAKTHDRAAMFKPMAERVKDLSDNMNSYIEELKKDIIQKASIKKNDGSDSLQEDNQAALTYLFDTKGKGEEFYKKLLEYDKNIEAIDSDMMRNLGDKLKKSLGMVDSSGEINNNPTKIFLNSTSVIAAIALLDKFQNAVDIVENELVQYCNYKINDGGDFYDQFRVLLSVSTHYAKAGEEISVIGGVGSFSKAAMPSFFINGKNVSINDDAVAVYKFKASSKPGEYYIPIKVSFIKPDGSKSFLISEVEYTVFKDSCQTSN